jgi:uncharacterized protein YndB with AHSA1/START domain
MSKQREIDIHVDTAATPDTVFALLADSTTWPAWSTIESVTLEREGSPAPEGVGAIRVNQRGRVTGRDEILEVVPNQRFVYRSLSGLPVRDYVGRVELERTVTGTSIHWHSEFFPKIPGTGRIMERGIGKFLMECASGLADYAATHPARKAG